MCYTKNINKNIKDHCRMNILIVDDTEPARELLKALLEEADFPQTKEASSAAEAFAILGIDEKGGEFIGNDIDLILMDLTMPDINGIEACRIIKAVEKFHDIPIIMVTAMDDPESIETAFEAGATDYVKKPFDMIELTSRVRSALRLKSEMDRRKAREKELEKALSEISVLHGLIPICCHCKKIRDDKGYWEDVDTYISKHSEIMFSHSVCEECQKEHYPDYYNRAKRKED